jgi:hypothetical protein
VTYGGASSRHRPATWALHRAGGIVLNMTSAAPTAITPAAADWHRRQRDLVAASLIARPQSGRPTHRRWA